MYSSRRCLKCHDRIAAENRKRYYAQRAAERRRKPNFRAFVLWNEAQLNRLRWAAKWKLTLGTAQLLINAVGPARSINAIRKMMACRYMRGLTNGRPRGHTPKPRWTPERLEELYAAVRKYGPREAGRRLGCGPNAVAGALHRYPPPG